MPKVYVKFYILGHLFLHDFEALKCKFDMEISKFWYCLGQNNSILGCLDIFTIQPFLTLILFQVSLFIVIFYSILFHSFCLWKAFILNFVYYCFKNQSDFFFLFLKTPFFLSLFLQNFFLLKISLQLDGIISSATFWGEEPVLNYSNGHLYLRYTCLSLSPGPTSIFLLSLFLPFSALQFLSYFTYNHYCISNCLQSNLLSMKY